MCPDQCPKKKKMLTRIFVEMEARISLKIKEAELNLTKVLCVTSTIYVRNVKPVENCYKFI